MTTTHDTQTGILTVTISRDEHLALTAAILPVQTETAITGRAIMDGIYNRKQDIGLKVSEIRLVLEPTVPTGEMHATLEVIDRMCRAVEDGSIIMRAVVAYQAKGAEAVAALLWLRRDLQILKHCTGN